MKEGTFGSKITVPHIRLVQDAFYFDYVKRELVYQCGEFLIPQIIDSGNYHVIKMDMYRDDGDLCTDFYLRGTHTLAQEKTVILSVIDDVEFEIPATARECCQWCGTILSLDKRGACDTCGGYIK